MAQNGPKTGPKWAKTGQDFKLWPVSKPIVLVIPEDPALNPYMPKRYSQFQTMFRHFYSAQQLINTYGYGCYCLNLGDRPLAGILAGVYPVDAKDKHCFEFTRCNRCVTFDFGPDCTPEQIDYNVSIIWYILYDMLYEFGR